MSIEKDIAMVEKFLIKTGLDYTSPTVQAFHRIACEIQVKLPTVTVMKVRKDFAPRPISEKDKTC